MYESFFGFREKPFAMTPDPGFIFLSRNHREAFAHLLYGINNRAGFVSLTGEVGSGKTTILRTLLNQLEGENYRTALIFNPCSSATELLQSVNREYGIPSDGESQSKLLAALNEFLLEQNAAGRTVVLAIDEAQNLQPAVLEQIRLISNLETEKEKLIQVLLVGQPELGEILGKSELRQLNQRITVRYHLTSMDREDTAAYIRHRLDVAGGSDRAAFTGAALKKVFRHSRGLPRLINILCDRALLAAYTNDSRQVGVPAVAAAAADIGLAAGPLRDIKSPQLAGLIAMIVLASAGLYFSLSEGIAQKAPSPPAQAPKTAAFLPADAGKTLPDSTGLTESFNALAEAWKVAPLTDGAVRSASALERAARERGLSVHRFNGNLGSLLRMDYPAILEVASPGKEGPRYAALMAERSGSLTFVPAPDRRSSLSGRDLEKIWTGRGYILWKDTLKLPAVTREGARGAHVERLQGLLREEGFYKGQVTGVFDRATASAVRDFQRRHGLDPDGVIGSQTLMLLSRDRDPLAPSLSGGKGG